MGPVVSSNQAPALAIVLAEGPAGRSWVCFVIRRLRPQMVELPYHLFGLTK
jgi:hypothetical protein